MNLPGQTSGFDSRKHHDFYEVQRKAVIWERLAKRITAQEAAGYLSRLDKAERDGAELDITADLLDSIHEKDLLAQGEER
jgi:hypothetical protein